MNTYWMILCEKIIVIYRVSYKLNCFPSGLRLESLEDCIEWMNIYWMILCEKSPGADYCDTDSAELPPGPLRPNNVFDFAYSLHKHSVSMELSVRISNRIIKFY